VMASALIRFPWTRHQAGFVITHIGIEILLAGSLIGARFGFDAQVHLSPGQSASSVEVEQDRLLVAVPGTDGTFAGYEIPLDLWSQTTWNGHWPAGQTMPMGGTGQAKITIVNWLASSRSNPNHAGEFIEAPMAPADLPHATKAVCLSIDFSGQQVRRWVAQGGVTSAEIAGNVIRLAYAPAEKPLPFGLSVASVRRANVSAGEPVGFATDVVFTAPDGTVSRQSVQINHPATLDGVSVFSGPVDEQDAASPVATLDVRKDPGRSLKYLGGALIVAGTIGVFMFGSVEGRKRRARKPAGDVEPTLITAVA